jgi:hypothetical protein
VIKTPPTYIILRMKEGEPGNSIQAQGFGAKGFGIAIVRKDCIKTLVMADTTDTVFRDFTATEIHANKVIKMQGIDREAYTIGDEPLTSSAYVYIANFERKRDDEFTV